MNYLKIDHPSTIYEEIYKLRKRIYKSNIRFVDVKILSTSSSHPYHPLIPPISFLEERKIIFPHSRRCKDVAIITSPDWPLSLHPSRWTKGRHTPHWKTHRISTGTSGASFKLQNRGDEATLYAEIPLNCKRPFSKGEGRESDEREARVRSSRVIARLTRSWESFTRDDSLSRFSYTLERSNILFQGRINQFESIYSIRSRKIRRGLI